MSPALKNAKSVENDRHLPFDTDGDPVEYSAARRRVARENDGSPSKSSAVRVPSSSNGAGNSTGNTPNEYDVDDEEDFIKIYFTSGTVLQPSDEPYNLRSKIHQANQELANDNESAVVANAPGKVKFDNTVVVLDSFEDVGTVSIGTERLQGADVFPDRNDPNGEDEILAQVDLSRNDEDDQDDVVVCSTAERTQDTTDEKAYSSTSFSRSFSSESDDPLFINVIESGDEFKTIMDRNNRTRQGSAIDEHVTYFPELFTRAQYKIYEKSDKTSGDDNDADIYVPKKLDADQLRSKLKEISRERKGASTNGGGGGGGGVKKASANGPAKKLVVGGSFAAQNKTKPTKGCDRNRAAARLPPAAAAAPPRPHRRHGKPRVTYYFELDPKGKLKPLNKNNANGTQPHANGKFFRINLKATGDDGHAAGGRPRATKTPNTDLFLEFQTDRSGNKGAKLVIKKKPAEGAATCGGGGGGGGGGAAKKSAAAERPRLPGYNGLRSEYGLSAEQLLERRRMKTERETRRKECRQKRHEEEQKKRAENEKNFYKWLLQKKQAKKQSKTRHSYPMNRLTVSSARNSSINFAHIGSQRKGSFALEELLKIKDENNGWFKF